MEKRFKEQGSQCVVIIHRPKITGGISNKRQENLQTQILSKVRDFAKGIGIQCGKNEVEHIFMIAGTFANNSEIQYIPKNVEVIDIDDQKVYILGKVTGDIVSSISGTVRSVSGIMTIGAGIGGTVGGALASTTGAGALAGVPVMVVSGSAIAAGSVELAQGVGVVYSSLGNLGKDLSEFRTTKKITSPNQMQSQVEKGQAPKNVDRVDKSDPLYSKPHVHFKDGTSITIDGEIHDSHNGKPKLSREVLDWLHINGWCLNIK